MTAIEAQKLWVSIEDTGYRGVPFLTANGWNVLVTFGEREILIESWEEFAYERAKYEAHLK